MPIGIAEALGLEVKYQKDATAVTFGEQHTKKSYRVPTVLRNPVTGTPVKRKLWTRLHITSILEQMNTNHTVLSNGSSETDIFIRIDYYWSAIDLNLTGSFHED